MRLDVAALAVEAEKMLARLGLAEEEVGVAATMVRSGVEVVVLSGTTTLGGRPTPATRTTDGKSQRLPLPTALRPPETAQEVLLRGQRHRAISRKRRLTMETLTGALRLPAAAEAEGIPLGVLLRGRRHRAISRRRRLTMETPTSELALPAAAEAALTVAAEAVAAAEVSPSKTDAGEHGPCGTQTQTMIGGDAFKVWKKTTSMPLACSM